MSAGTTTKNPQPTIWERFAAAGLVNQAVEALIRHYGGITFVELEDLLAPFLPVAGDSRLVVEEGVVLWEQADHDLLQCVVDLVDANRVFYDATDSAHYLTGRRPRLPLFTGKSPKPGRAAWWPVILRACPRV
jgi:hypothetical protein